MADWSIQDLEQHCQYLLDDTNPRAEEERETLADFNEIKYTLSPNECRLRIGLMTLNREKINEDYSKYLELTLIIQDRYEAQRIQDLESQKEAQRLQAISELLTPLKLSELAHDEFSQRCAICFETFGNGYDEELPSRLPCGHVFGTTCVSTWLFEHGSCGFCRYDYSDRLGSGPAGAESQQPENVANVDADFYMDYETDFDIDGDGGSQDTLTAHRSRSVTLAPGNLSRYQQQWSDDDWSDSSSSSSFSTSDQTQDEGPRGNRSSISDSRNESRYRQRSIDNEVNTEPDTGSYMNTENQFIGTTQRGGFAMLASSRSQHPVGNRFPDDHEDEDSDSDVFYDAISDPYDPGSELLSNEDLEPVTYYNRDRFLEWGLSSQENLGVEDDLDGDEIMRSFDDDHRWSPSIVLNC